MSSEATSLSDTPAPWADFPALSREAWIERIQKDLKGASFEKLVWQTLDEIDIQPFYTALDVPQRPPLSSDRKGNTWLIRQDIDVSEVAPAKHLIREALAGGATSLGLHFSISVDAALMHSLLKGVALESVALHLESETPPGDLLDSLLHTAKQHDVSPTKLLGSIICNPINALVKSGKVVMAPQMDEIAHLLPKLTEMPAFRVFSVDARPFHNAGATPAQELGCTLAVASEYLVQSRKRELRVADIVSRFRFEVPVGTSFFAEIAKLRALRLLFPQLVRAFDEEVEPPFAHIRAETSQWSLTLFDPHTNLLRATTEAAAAMMGGCDELSIIPYDEATGASSDHARRLALNIQHVLKHESYLDVVADPVAGSYYLETLTDELAKTAWSFFQEIESHGGFISAMKAGFIQQATRASRDQRLAGVDSGQTVLVGTNTFPQLGETRLDDAGNPSISSPETSSVEPLPSLRAAAHFEALRMNTERHALATGNKPRVLSLLLGDPVMANARASFARNFFGVAGFDMLPDQMHETPEQAARAALEARPDIVVLCSTDENYTAIAMPIGHHLREAGHAPLLVVAGYPSDAIDDLKSAGIDSFIHKKIPLLDTLIELKDRLRT